MSVKRQPPTATGRYQGGTADRKATLFDRLAAAAANRPLPVKLPFDLHLADLSGKEIRAIDLRARNLEGADLSRTDMTRADVARSNLTQASLRNATLTSANFAGSTLDQASLADSDARGADLSGASLVGADLTGARLNDAYLTAADLRGANLSAADLNGTFLNAIVYDQTTLWPDGFTPPPSAKARKQVSDTATTRDRPQRQSVEYSPAASSKVHSFFDNTLLPPAILIGLISMNISIGYLLGYSSTLFVLLIIWQVIAFGWALYHNRILSFAFSISVKSPKKRARKIKLSRARARAAKAQGEAQQVEREETQDAEDEK